MSETPRENERISGRVRVTLESGRDLQTCGRVYVYCMVRVGYQKPVRSMTVEQGRNPVFNQTLEFSLRREDMGVPLVVEVKGQEAGCEDISIGVASLWLSIAFLDGEDRQSLPLISKWSKKQNGELSVAVEWTPAPNKPYILRASSAVCRGTNGGAMTHGSPARLMSLSSCGSGNTTDTVTGSGSTGSTGTDESASVGSAFASTTSSYLSSSRAYFTTKAPLKARAAPSLASIFPGISVTSLPVFTSAKALSSVYSDPLDTRHRARLH